jgi:hypothetical protein
MFVPFDKRLVGFHLLTNKIVEDDVAHLLASITIVWGRIESLLYAIGWAIDRKKAATWTAILFKVNALEARKLAAQNAIIAEMEVKRPQYVQQLTGALRTLDLLQKQRNLLVHGLWVHTDTANKFVVYPLRLESKGGDILAKGEAVDLTSLSKLADDMRGLANSLAMMTADMMAYQQLKKWGRT